MTRGRLLSSIRMVLENCRIAEDMALGETAERSSERRRRSRACSNLNASFSGGGVVLLLGAAAGVLLASALASHRIRCRKRRRGPTEEIQGDSVEHLTNKEGKEFVGDEGGEGRGDNEGEEANLHDNLDASAHISQADQREIDFYLLEEGEGEVVERNQTTDIQEVDGEHGEVACCRGSSADVNNINSSHSNACPNLWVGSSLEENQIIYDDEELLAAGVKEERKASFIHCKEDDGEDIKKAYIDGWGEREEIEENLTSFNQYSEQPGLIEENSCNYLHPAEALEFVEVEEELEGVTNTRTEMLQANTIDVLHGNLEILDFVKRESNIYLDKKVAERSPTKEIELVDGLEGQQSCLRGSRAKVSHPSQIISSPANVYNNLGIGNGLGEDQLRHGDEQLLPNSVREDGETSFLNSKEDGDSKKVYIEEWGEEESEEKNTRQNLVIEELCLSEKKAFQNMELVIAIEERNFEDGFKDEIYNFILGLATSSPFGDQDETNPINKEIEPFFEGTGEAKVLDIRQNNDSDKDAEMVILEDEDRMDTGGFKGAVALDTSCVEHGNEGDVSNEEMVEGSRGLCKQTVALPYRSTVTAISEPGTSTHNDLIMVMANEDLQLMDPTDAIMYIEEDKMGVEESNRPSADEGVEGLIDEFQEIKICIGDNPAMIMALEETIQLEDNANCDLNEVIQEEKTEENLFNGLEENVESSETEDSLRENEERPLTESQRIDYSLEQYNLMVDKTSPCLDDNSPLSMKIVEPIKDNILNSSEKTLEIEDFHFKAGTEESGTSTNEDVDEKQDEAISVQCHELETRQCIEPHKDHLEKEIEYPQSSQSGKKGVDEIHKESQAQLKKEEEDDEKQQNLKLCFDDLVEKRVKTFKQDTKTDLIDVARKHQPQVDCHETNVSSKGKQQRIATKKVKGTEYMFMGVPKGHIVLLMTIATAFAVLALLYTKYFITTTTILENFVTD